MESNDLLEGESLITSSGNGEVVLTSLRIRKTSTTGDSSTLTSILLRNVSSIYALSKRKSIYMIISLLCFAFGASLFILRNGETASVLFGAAIVFLILYFSSKRHLIIISSNGGSKINIHASGMKNSKIIEFINKTEKAIIQESNP